MQKKIIICFMTVISLILCAKITVMAATSGVLTGGLANEYAMATLKNTSDGSRYCQVTVLEYTTNPNATSTISNSERQLDANANMVTGGRVTKMHVKAIGTIYNSLTPNSGAGATYTTQIK